jgi:hypothetical protein
VTFGFGVMLSLGYVFLMLRGKPDAASNPICTGWRFGIYGKAGELNR